jgi:hypothetical protein
VEGFIDRLASLLRSLFAEDGRTSEGHTSEGRGSGATGERFRDPDLREAWEELDEYMATGSNDAAGTRTGRQSTRPRPPVDEALRPDYANLEVPFGSDIEMVRKSYKSLMLKYHPDKHAGDPEKQRIALEITKKINESFERIRARHEGGARSS